VKLIVIAPGLAVSPIFAHRRRESSPAGERLTGAHALERLSLLEAVHPAVLALVSLVCEAAREKGILLGVCGEVGASLSTAPPSMTRIEKLVGEL